MRTLVIAMGFALGALVLATPAHAEALAECTIDFDSACPNFTTVCGANFVGGLGCWPTLEPFCIDTGFSAWQVTQAAPVTINLSGDLVGIEVFFAYEGAGASGLMRFLDAQDNEVATISTSEICTGPTRPVSHVMAFPTPVRKIEVSAVTSGSNQFVWLDTLHINPAGVPIETVRWGAVKGRYAAD